MNEPKRRGRPPKAKPNAQIEGADKGCADCGQVVGHYDDCPVGMGVLTKVLEQATVELRVEVDRQLPGYAAQAYANRVWAGQGHDVPRSERLKRVKIALDGQGLSMEGVVL